MFVIHNNEYELEHSIYIALVLKGDVLEQNVIHSTMVLSLTMALPSTTASGTSTESVTLAFGGCQIDVCPLKYLGYIIPASLSSTIEVNTTHSGVLGEWNILSSDFDEPLL